MARRFVTAVMRHETNTFSPIPTPIADFGRIGPTDGPARGDEAYRVYAGTNNPVAAYIDIAKEEGAELVFPVAANAHPSAPAPGAIIDLCADAIIEAVEKGCDALFLDLHGAMVTQEHDDGEGDLLTRIRAAANGDDTARESF
ncbi:MAG: M81 family metallopeptidase, partial [Rhodospirillaceae bacterium]|nr:M81 family metallopeptidase [Rhodospirillaceae bacterium]